MEHTEASKWPLSILWFFLRIFLFLTEALLIKKKKKILRKNSSVDKGYSFFFFLTEI